MEKLHKKPDVWDKGFTLIEVVMVIMLLGIIASTATIIIYQGARSYGEEEVRKDLTTQGRLAIERMAREIRLVNCRCTTPANTCTPSGSNCTSPNADDDITNMGGSEFRFINTNFEGKGFRVNAGSLMLCTNSASCVGNEDALAGNVTNLSFQYLDNAGNPAGGVGAIWTIVASLTLTRDNQSVNFRIQIHPRKFK